VLREDGIEHVADELLASPGELGNGIELAFELGGGATLGAARRNGGRGRKKG